MKMRNTIRKLTAVGLILTTMASATSALAEQAGAPIWKAYLQPDHLLPVAPSAAATSEAAASATLWNSYLPTGPVGSPQVSAYSEAQVRSRIPWYVQVSATTGSQSRTLAGLGR
jgi:hypothetical protein